MSPRGRLARPRVSSFSALEAAAVRFRPLYEIGERSERALSITLRDAEGRRPDIVLRHRQFRRMFFRANYLVVESDVPGSGPAKNGQLSFRFRGPLARQRATLRWKDEVADGAPWIARLQEPLLAALRDVEAVEGFRVLWKARSRTWHLELETMSGSMVGGFMTALPIAVPLDAAEVRGIVGLVDALAATAG